MSSTVGLQSDMDDAIRDRPELVNAIRTAAEVLTDYTDQAGTHPLLRWRLPPSDEPVIELTLSETTETGTGVARRKFPLRYMFDPVNRDISVLRVWGDLLAERSKRSMARISQLVRQLEEEERNGPAIAE